MTSLNRVTLLGYVGRDPEIRSTQAGSNVASFSLATSESWTDKQSGEKREKTEWHNIVAFGDGLCGIIQNHVRKGLKVYLEGQIQTRKWQDKSGADRYTTEIVLQGYRAQIILLDPPQQRSAPQRNEQQSLPVGKKKKVLGNIGDMDPDDLVPF